MACGTVAADLLGERGFLAGAENDRRDAACQQAGGKGGVVACGPALDRAVGGAAGDQQGETVRQCEAGEIGAGPGKVGRQGFSDAGGAELAELAVKVVQAVAVRVAVGMRGAERDAGPFGAGVGGNRWK